MIARLTPRSPPCVLLSARRHLRCRCHCSTLYPDARVFPALLVVCTLETFTVYCDASPARYCCRKIHALTLFTHLAPTQIRTPGYVRSQGPHRCTWTGAVQLRVSVAQKSRALAHELKSEGTGGGASLHCSANVRARTCRRYATPNEPISSPSLCTVSASALS
jgi:hypothetical protein